MKIKKILNHNAALAVDSAGNEIVYTGCGICFRKKAGDPLDESKIEKTFVMEKPCRQFEKLVSELPYEQIQVADEIIRYASDTLNRRLSKNIYITLTDHLGYAIQRAEEGTFLKNKLLWDIKNYYKTEFKIGCHALEIIKSKLGIELPEDEAGFFALHVVNAELDGNMHHTVATSEVINDIVSIVKYTFKTQLDEDSLSFERFVTHLKYFLQRAERREYYPSDSRDLYLSMKDKFPAAFKCASRIKSYMESRYPDEITDEEMLYLVVHISRITDRR
ncbi:transcriptional antiterminator, BglG family [Pseudobutyrivibrio sp. ACV-2]|uniref:BglG family transcription antiterminator LicT n=1 Tax=Pseudobutyrivibrio sp. ACV-2 TaxID=1520801 RepID=UPI00089B0BE0|nr:PRD domain-containing protein [Pseudobutyrivibrio sp. ACV-2]SEA06694.1 transcriptional antiterminator, BglG family [Pseudobutyrivibrio sp. ACV-2]